MVEELFLVEVSCFYLLANSSIFFFIKLVGVYFPCIFLRGVCFSRPSNILLKYFSPFFRTLSPSLWCLEWIVLSSPSNSREWGKSRVSRVWDKGEIGGRHAVVQFLHSKNFSWEIISLQENKVFLRDVNRMFPWMSVDVW